MPSNASETAAMRTMLDESLTRLRDRAARISAEASATTDTITEVVEEARATLNLPTDGRTFPDVENLVDLTPDQLREVIVAMQTWRNNLSTGLQSFADDHQMHSTWDGFVTQYGLPGRMRTYIVQQERSLNAPIVQRRTLMVNARSPLEARDLAAQAGATPSTSSRATVRLYDDWQFQQIGTIPQETLDDPNLGLTTLQPRIYS